MHLQELFNSWSNQSQYNLPSSSPKAVRPPAQTKGQCTFAGKMLPTPPTPRTAQGLSVHPEGWRRAGVGASHCQGAVLGNSPDSQHGETAGSGPGSRLPGPALPPPPCGLHPSRAARPWALCQLRQQGQRTSLRDAPITKLVLASVGCRLAGVTCEQRPHSRRAVYWDTAQALRL